MKISEKCRHVEHHLALTGRRENMEDSEDILTINEIARVLRCSKAHVANVMQGKVRGLPRLMHLPLGRRKVVRRAWLQEWMEANKAR